MDTHPLVKMAKGMNILGESVVDAERRCDQLERKFWAIVNHWNEWGHCSGFGLLIQQIEKDLKSRRWSYLKKE